MRFQAACSTEGIVSREEGDGNEAVEEQGEVSSSLVMDRLETVLTGLFIHVKWDRDLSERGRGKGRVRRPEGACVELASGGKGAKEGPRCCEVLCGKSTGHMHNAGQAES